MSRAERQMHLDKVVDMGLTEHEGDTVTLKSPGRGDREAGAD